MSDTKNKGGRPTDYKPEYCGYVEAYLDQLNETELPLVTGFAKYLGVAKSTLYEWKDKYKEFSDSLSQIIEAQEIQLINDGIYGGKEVNATIVKLLLQNNHGMREKQDTDITSNGETIAISDEQLKRIIKG